MKGSTVSRAVSARSGTAPRDDRAGARTQPVGGEASSTLAMEPAQLPGPSAIESRQSARAYRAWDDAPLQVKITLVVLLAVVGGVLIGMTEAVMGFPVWALSAGVIALVVVLVSLGRTWIVVPFERLLETMRQAQQEERPTRLSGLPLSRRDEIGQLARIMHNVYMEAARDWHEARRLRRTLDHRVEKATEQATRQLRHIAFRDGLTEVANRRFLEEHLPLLVKSALESNTDLVCIAVDMDNFKQVNDTFGHAAGDELLIFLASLVQASIRQQDYVVRLGGDEFVILLPGCDLDRAGQLAEQIIALFRQHARTALPGDVHADLSMGISSLRRDGAQTAAELLQCADKQLYAAKGAGKGRVVGA